MEPKLPISPPIHTLQPASAATARPVRMSTASSVWLIDGKELQRGVRRASVNCSFVAFVVLAYSLHARLWLPTAYPGKRIQCCEAPPPPPQGGSSQALPTPPAWRNTIRVLARFSRRQDQRAPRRARCHSCRSAAQLMRTPSCGRMSSRATRSIARRGPQQGVRMAQPSGSTTCRTTWPYPTGPCG